MLNKIIVPKIYIFLIALAFICLGCSSTSLITSDPLGAEVYIDGLLVGKTPYSYKRKWTPKESIKLITEKREPFDSTEYKVLKMESMLQRDMISKEEFNRLKKKLLKTRKPIRPINQKKDFSKIR